MNRCDVLAEAAWYVDHVAPVWRALPARARGVFYVRNNATAVRAAEYGIATQQWDNSPGGLTLVAAFGDLRKAHEAGRRTVLAEHGAGQTYRSAHPSYAGGHAPARDACELFLVPGSTPGQRLRDSHPDAHVVEVGSPRVDALRDIGRQPRAEVPTVVVSWHWDCTVCPETRWAWPQFAQAVNVISRRSDMRVLGHGHPRAMARLAPWYRRVGIEVVESFDDVVAQADVYVVDNSSTMFEAAACGIPVVVVNSPRYRRNVNHGIRFWDTATIGPQANTGAELLPAINRALRGHPADVAERERCLDLVYTHRDGTSAKRAASAILEHLEA
jgi:hypothetical protein